MRQRTRKERMSAVLVADRLNSTEAAAKETGIPARTIREWMKDPELAELRRKTREETAEEITVVQVLAWTRLIERLKADEIETRDLIILAGVATDKAQLLSGNATARTEAVSITDGLSLDTKRALRERLARAVRGESDTDRTGGKPVGTGGGVAGPGEGGST